MTSDTFTITSQVIIPFAIVVGGIVLGLIIEMVILGKLKERSRKRNTRPGKLQSWGFAT